VLFRRESTNEYCRNKRLAKSLDSFDFFDPTPLLNLAIFQRNTQFLGKPRLELAVFAESPPSFAICQIAEPDRGKPYHPMTQGKIERYHACRAGRRS
jgi:hypothetical protein